MAEKIVIIGASDFQDPLIRKAKEKGYETHVFAWKDGAVGEKTADYFYPVSITEKEKILEICRELRPAGIASIGSDLAVITVNYLAEQLGLRGNGPENTRLATNKYEMRRAFAAHGDPSPRFRLIREENQEWEELTEGLRYPLIVKPADRSGSRGITKLDGPEGLAEAAKAAMDYSFLHQAVIEEYMQGEEFSVEFISYAGRHHFLAMTRKFTTGAPHFIETGHVQPAGVEQPAAERVKQVVSHALDTLHVVWGASHAEVMIDSQGQVSIVEIGARMGGDCIGSDLVPLSTGYDFVGMVVDIACGKPLRLERGPHHREARIRFVCGPEDLERFRKIAAAGEEQVVRVSAIEPFDGHQVVDSSTRYGYMITVKD